MPGISTSSRTRSYCSFDAHSSALVAVRGGLDEKAFLDEAARERVAVELAVVDDEN